MTTPDQTSSILAVRKGRGATYDPHNRFAPTRSEAEDDGWWREEAFTNMQERTEQGLNTRDFRPPRAQQDLFI